MSGNFVSRVRVAPDVLFRELDGESVILDLKSERYLGLDPVATRMWQLITSCESVAAAYELLVQEYDAEPAQIRQDMDEFLQKLLSLGLVETGPDGLPRTG